MFEVSNPRALPRYGKIPAHAHKHLPDRPNLEHLKAQAKTLLRDFLAGKKDGIRRVRRFMPEKLAPVTGPYPRPSLRLKDAQYILAREYTKGPWKFGSWEELKVHVEAVNECSDALIVEQIGRLGRNAKPSLLNAHRFLGALGPRMIPHLIEALKSSRDTAVRLNCLGFLDHLNVPTDESFAVAVAGALTDRVPKVRRAALHTLCCQRCKSIPVDLQPGHVRLIVQLAVTDENTRVRAEAEATLRMLAQQGRTESILNVLREFSVSQTQEFCGRAQSIMAALRAT